MRQDERKPELSGRQGAEQVRAVVLILPGGQVRSHRGRMRIAERGLRGLARRFAAGGEPDGIAVHMVRYRFRGWNDESADTAADTRWALEEVQRRYGDVPVALFGHSLGGRAAFWCAGHPSVTSVVGLSPWLPAGDPVDQLAGRKALIMHGDKDRSDASPQLSLAFARRARQVTPDVARFEVVGGGHLMIDRGKDCGRLAAEFLFATIGSRPFSPLLAEALKPEGDLGTPVPVGYNDELKKATAPDTAQQ